MPEGVDSCTYVYIDVYAHMCACFTCVWHVCTVVALDGSSIIAVYLSYDLGKDLAYDLPLRLKLSKKICCVGGVAMFAVKHCAPVRTALMHGCLQSYVVVALFKAPWQSATGSRVDVQLW